MLSPLSKKIKSIAAWAGVAALLSLPWLTLGGASDVFLKLKGVPGESADDVHKGEIDVLSWSWGASAPVAIGSGSAGAGLASFQNLSVTKWVDRATPVLLMKLVTGDMIESGTLVVRAAGDKPLEYLKLEMGELFVTSQSTGGDAGDDRFTENVSFAISNFKLIYVPQTKEGSDEPIEFSWDIKNNEKL